MSVRDDHESPGALSREMSCSVCEHVAHSGYCLDDLIEGVRCPCHSPIPGSANR